MTVKSTQRGWHEVPKTTVNRTLCSQANATIHERVRHYVGVRKGIRDPALGHEGRVRETSMLLIHETCFGY